MSLSFAFINDDIKFQIGLGRRILDEAARLADRGDQEGARRMITIAAEINVNAVMVTRIAALTIELLSARG